MADLTRTVAVDVDETPAAPQRRFEWPWQVPTVVGALGVALAGWVLLAGLTTLVWLGDTRASFGDALVLATKLFSLAHGAPAELGGQHVTLVPLGLTALLVFLALPIVGHAARRAVTEAGEVPDLELIVWQVGGLYAGVYTLTVTVATAAIVGGTAAGGTFVGAAVVGLIAGLWGSAGAVGHDPTAAWPTWVQAVPRALAVACCTMLAVGSVIVAMAIFLGADRIEAITSGLAPDIVGGISLIAIHLLYLPNLILWACSWALGAGVTFGDGSLASLVVTDVGLMPAIPVFGAVPEPGIAGTAGLWWLTAGVVAGALAGLAVAWARPRARFDETALVGGLSGLLAGALLTLAASVASGGLGHGRLAHIGARVDQLIVFAPVLLGLSGLIAGLVLGLIRRPPAAPAATDDVGPAPDAETKEEA